MGCSPVNWCAHCAGGSGRGLGFPRTGVRGAQQVVESVLWGIESRVVEEFQRTNGAGIEALLVGIFVTPGVFRCPAFGLGDIFSEMRTVPPSAVLTKLTRLRCGSRVRVVDLFSGCGGMSLGFRSAGCDIVAGIEKEAVRARTHARNFHSGAAELRHGVARDITENSPADILRELGGGLFPDVDIIVGGPPCQAYARVGRAKLREIAKHSEAHLNDPRGGLYAAYLRWVEATAPVAVVMENVPDILRFGGVNVGELIARGLDDLGYETRYTLLNAANYGVPQTRERWFLIGLHKALGVRPSFPIPVHHFELPVGYRGTRAEAARWSRLPAEDRPDHAEPLVEVDPTLPPAVTCEEALADLPVISTRSKLGQKRGARDLSALRPYNGEPAHPYQAQMRSWLEHDPAAGVTAHVIRSLPRDYETFARMEEGADYPRARDVAEQIFAERLAAAKVAGQDVGEGTSVWNALWKSTVPPYDPSKFPNKWRKLERDFPSRTLLAHLSHDTYSHIHYDSVQARTISVREAARLQSFPDGFQFCGAMNAAFGMIGNAVPPLMAKAIALTVRNDLGIGTPTG